jgi:hypothetical protein
MSFYILKICHLVFYISKWRPVTTLNTSLQHESYKFTVNGSLSIHDTDLDTNNITSVTTNQVGERGVTKAADK